LTKGTKVQKVKIKTQEFNYILIHFQTKKTISKKIFLYNLFISQHRKANVIFLIINSYQIVFKI